MLPAALINAAHRDLCAARSERFLQQFAPAVSAHDQYALAGNLLQGGFREQGLTVKAVPGLDIDSAPRRLDGAGSGFADGGQLAGRRRERQAVIHGIAADENHDVRRCGAGQRYGQLFRVAADDIDDGECQYLAAGGCYRLSEFRRLVFRAGLQDAGTGQRGRVHAAGSASRRAAPAASNSSARAVPICAASLAGPERRSRSISLPFAAATSASSDN